MLYIHRIVKHAALSAMIRSAVMERESMHWSKRTWSTSRQDTAILMTQLFKHFVDNSRHEQTSLLLRRLKESKGQFVSTDVHIKH